MPRQLSDPALAADWCVVALCAEWCDTCRDYRRAFEQRAATALDARHVWVDIEDDADWLGELDVETFPTLLVLRGAEPQFYGPVTPAIEVVERTLRALQRAGGGAAAIPAGERDPIERLIARIGSGR